MTGDAPVSGPDIFLNDHRIGTLGEGSACKDAHRLPTFHRALEAMPRRRNADQLKLGAISRNHRVAIHGGALERRLVAAGFQRQSQHPADGLGKRHIFHA